MGDNPRRAQAIALAKALPVAEFDEYISETFPVEVSALGIYSQPTVEEWLDSNTFLAWVASNFQRKKIQGGSLKRPRSSQNNVPTPGVPSATTFGLAHARSSPLPGPQQTAPTNTTMNLTLGGVATPPLADGGHGGFPNSDSESDGGHKRPPVKRARKSEKSKGKSVSGGELVKITRQQKVETLVELNEVPLVWDVAKSRAELAYYVDKTSDVREWKREGGSEMNIASYILNKSQDSWNGKTKGGKSQGTGGSRKTLVKVAALGGVNCRYVTHRCSGSLMCSKADQSQLAGCMRFTDDTDQTREQWEAERSVNAQDSSSAKAHAISFWRSIIKKRCGALISDEDGSPVLCEGTPVVRKLSAASQAKNRDGKTMFIGCSDSGNGNDRRDHQCYWIPRDVEETLVQELWKPGCNIDTFLSEDGSTSLTQCARIIHPRAGEKGSEECPYSHTEDGKPVVGIMVVYDCNVEIRIWYPDDIEDRRAIVQVVGECGHNHPAWPKTKLTLDSKLRYEEAIRAQGITGTTVLKVDNASLTREIFGGKTPAAADPALANSRIRRRQTHMEVELKVSVLHEKKVESSTPVKDRYIHKIVSENEIDIIITLVPGLARLIHDAEYTVHDNTYKRTAGAAWKEWEVVVWCRRLSKRVTVARIYATRETRAAFRAMFEALWDTVEEVTGQAVQFKFLDGKGLKAVIMDGCKPQVDGCGDDLVKRAALRGPPVLVQEKESHVIVQYIVKTCAVHVERKFTDMAKSVPLEDMERIRGSLHVREQSDLDEFIAWCRQSPHKVVRDWISDKLSAPWFFPSLNCFLSKMDPNDFNATPHHTNLNESAHPFTNAHTGTNLSIVEAIKSARKLDFDQLALIENMESSFVLENIHNTQHERAKSNMRRAANRTRKAIHNSEAQEAITDAERKIKELQAFVKGQKAESGIKRISPQKESTGKIAANLRMITDQETTGSPSDIEEIEEAELGPGAPFDNLDLEDELSPPLHQPESPPTWAEPSPGPSGSTATAISPQNRLYGPTPSTPAAQRTLGGNFWPVHGVAPQQGTPFETPVSRHVRLYGHQTPPLMRGVHFEEDEELSINHPSSPGGQYLMYDF